MKICACGQAFDAIPASSQVWDLGHHGQFWLWECKCKSHLVYPKDDATSLTHGLPLMPIANEELGMDAYHEAKEQEIVAEMEQNLWDLATDD